LEALEAGQPGLEEPSVEVIRALLAIAGGNLQDAELPAKFVHHASIALRRSRLVATMNGLNIDVEQEGKAVEIFREMLQHILSHSSANEPLVNLPSWEGLNLEKPLRLP
jgi:hypothetical protein